MAHIRMIIGGGTKPEIKVGDSIFYADYGGGRLLCFEIPIVKVNKMSFNWKSIANGHGYSCSCSAKLKDGTIQQLFAQGAPATNATVTKEIILPNNTESILFANVDNNNWADIVNTITGNSLTVSARWTTGMGGTYSWMLSNFVIIE